MNHPTTIDVAELLSLTRERNCTYLVMPNNKELSEAPEKFGLELLDTIEGYPIYFDPVAKQMLEERFG